MATTLSISELLQLQSTLRREANKAEAQIAEGAYTETNGDIETESVSVEELEAAIGKLDELNALSIQVADKLHDANRGTVVTHTKANGSEVNLNLASALDYVKQVRRKAALFELLGNQKKTSVQNVYGGSERIITERSYDIEHYAKESEALMKEANRLSREIERQSVLVMVEVNGVDAYL
ncbi:hypothetical protein [Planococcus lenghuensis]|uniref:Uncharacterized protein n=1 Tax=Planococcus lenghuensis TaxID=2213202 RepID=A0A1Q2KVI3_9BACL|nr:hypothetical protein [Planococcus lenghuensis]AQQ52235.1 hypothetical protein B0X71_03325 [Planococcus lenghuensis]